MRAKNKLGYVVALVFILLCFLASTFLYELNVSSIKDSSIKTCVDTTSETNEKAIDNSILNYKLNITQNPSGYSVASVINESIFDNTFYAFSKSRLIETDGGEDYFLYIKTDNVYKISIDEFLNSLKHTSTALFIVSGDDVVGSIPSYLNSDRLLSTIIAKSGNSESVVNNIKEAMNKEEFYYTSAKLQVSSDATLDGYLSIRSLGNLKIVSFVDEANIYINQTSINTLMAVYYVCVSCSIILLVILFMVVINKSAKGSTDSFAGNARSANIIVNVSPSGKVLKHNRAYKAAFLPEEPLKSLADASVIESDKDLKSLIRSEKTFKLKVNGKTDDEGSKISDDIYLEFYSLKRGSGYMLVGRNITSEYLDEERLIKISTKSVITGDNNGFILETRYREVKEKFLAVGDRFDVIMTDFRGFKDVNTLLGYKSGNDVLAYYSKYLHEVFEGYEIFHITGDEFVVLGTEKTDSEIYSTIDKLLDGLKAPIKFGGNEIMLRPAVGIVSADMDSDKTINYESLMDKLREACNKAKSAVGKSICKYDANLENSANKKREMEEDLKKAIDNGEFVMFYQPQYELQEERVCGFEALLRWNNPKYATISPEVYIKMAEQNGYIIDVGNFINRDVFKTAKEMEQYDIHISVNVSPAQIVQAGFVSDFLNEFEKNDLKPGAIALEVTETFLMENFSSVVEKLKILKNRGISIHLDDFGTGYSSMLYLKELPIDTIKVDKEFIKHIETDRFSKVLTSKIISLGKELGTTVIVEGVETKAQKDIVNKFGADVIQGYYIGKALSKEDAFTLLKTGKVSSENKSNGKASEE